MSGLARRAVHRRWPVVVAVLIAAIAAMAMVTSLLFLDFFGPFVLLALSLGTFAVVGLVIAVRRPAQPVGWLFLIAGTCYSTTLTASAWTWRAIVVAPASLPGGELAAWLTSSLWVPAVATTLFAVILFPDGRPPSVRWRPVLALAAGALVVTALVEAFGRPRIALPAPMMGGLAAASPASIPNPLAANGWFRDVLQTVAPATAAVPVPLFLLTLLAVVLRFRRSRGVERQQLKWFASGAGVSVAALTVSLLSPIQAASDITWAAGMLSWGLVPIATGIAILRHQLFDIDLVIRRTLVYSLVVAVLAAIYVALVLATQAMLTGLTGAGPLPVALSTLAIAALFGPVRVRARAFVDRRFYRSRYDAQRTIDAFASHLRDEVELRAVAADLVAVAAGAVRPVAAGLWLRGRA